MTENQPHNPAPGTVGAEAFRQMGEYAQAKPSGSPPRPRMTGGPAVTTANRRLSWTPEAAQ